MTLVARIYHYKEMLLGFSRVRNLNRKIFIVPVMTPKLSLTGCTLLRLHHTNPMALLIV